jgi:hypothetical protein
VYEAFTAIIGQSRKLMKQETKSILEELSAKIEEERAKMVRCFGIDYICIIFYYIGYIYYIILENNLCKTHTDYIHMKI